MLVSLSVSNVAAHANKFVSFLQVHMPTAVLFLKSYDRQFNIIVLAMYDVYDHVLYSKSGYIGLVLLMRN